MVASSSPFIKIPQAQVVYFIMNMKYFWLSHVYSIFQHLEKFLRLGHSSVIAQIAARAHRLFLLQGNSVPAISRHHRMTDRQTDGHADTQSSNFNHNLPLSYNIFSLIIRPSWLISQRALGSVVRALPQSTTPKNLCTLDLFSLFCLAVNMM